MTMYQHCRVINVMFINSYSIYFMNMIYSIIYNNIISIVVIHYLLAVTILILGSIE